MAIRLGNDPANSPRKAQTTALATAFDAGTTNSSARLMFYTGSQPATPQTTATGTLLATLAFASTAFAAVDSNAEVALTGGTPLTGTIAASGTAGWFRVVDRNNRGVMDGSIGLTGADMLFDRVDFVETGDLTITAFNISTPM